MLTLTLTLTLTCYLLPSAPSPPAPQVSLAVPAVAFCSEAEMTAVCHADPELAEGVRVYLSARWVAGPAGGYRL